MRSAGQLGIVDALAGRAWSERRVAVLSIGWAWGVYLALIAARLAIIRFHPEVALLGRHCLIALAGAGLTWCVHLALRGRGHLAVVPRVAFAMVAALPAAALMTLVNYGALYSIAPEAVWPAQVLRGITLPGVVARTLPDMYFVLATWAALYGSVTGALESRDAQRRAVALQAEVRDAQLRALRYQLNPHFLFNALNSLSALVMLDDKDRAERVIQTLSAFLRSTLDDGGTEDTTLSEELAMQRLYLEIEQVRFEDRFRVVWSVPDELGPAQIPPLLLQPAVENVLRHAVAPARRPVTMKVAAHVGSDGLHVMIEDDGLGDGVPGGAGIGLSNVAARLRARYGDRARCDYGQHPLGGFRVEIVLPFTLRRAGI